MDALWENAFFVWIGLPILIVLARMADVTIGTMRIIFVMRGAKLVAGILGFAEVFIWIVVIGRLLTDSATLFHYAAYAGGFALGTVLGISIEQRLAFGLQTIRIITSENIDPLVELLRKRGFGGTKLAARGIYGREMTLLFSTVRRKHVPEVLKMIYATTPKAFISVEDVCIAREGVIPPAGESLFPLRLFSSARKGK